MTKEQFGTDTPLYNKHWYTSRGQLAEIRVSSSYAGPTDTSWNRGAIINHYSLQCWGMCDGYAMPDNNGNVYKQEHEIPLDDQISSHVVYTTWHYYDSLNRLLSVNGDRYNSVTSQFTNPWKQTFIYDRYGNRRIDPNAANTYGGVNNKDFTVNTANNRLGVPGGQSGVMSYDNAGNLTTDTYTGAGSRTYDAENRMTQAAGGLGGTQYYTYNADGQRTRRKIDGVETWQVYGFEGELLAEYAANAAVGSPQKEYGYRNGQLLITATAGTATNVALQANGGVAVASSTTAPYLPAFVNDGSRRAINGSVWADGTNGTFPDWVEVSFNGSKTISEIDVITQQDNYQNPVEPTLVQTFSLYGITAFEVQYWNGSGWVTVPGGSVTGNNKVWRRFNFTPVTTSKIQVLVNNALAGYSRIVEVEAWSDPTATGLRGHWKFDENTGTTTADASGSGNTGTLTSGAGWSTGQSGAAVNLDGVNDYVQVGAQSSLVLTTAASISAWIYPTGPGSNSTYGGIIVNKEGEYELARYPNGTIQWAFANSNPGWNFINTGYVAPLNQWTHLAVTYDNGTIKTYANGNLVHSYQGAGAIGDTITGQNDFRIGGRQAMSQHFQGRIDEVRVYNRALSAEEVSMLQNLGANIKWLVADHLGTPRMVLDQTGSLANTKRHDYLPFGEELFAGTGGRTTAQGYVADNVRQKFTSKERDIETGLDYFEARYYASAQGRFTSPDEFTGGPTELFADVAAHNPTFYAELAEPQSLNKYQYALNNPLKFVDPDGHQSTVADALRWVPVVSVIPGVREAAVVVAVTVIIATAIDSIPGEKTAGDGSCPSCDANIRNYQRQAQEKFDAQQQDAPKEVTIDANKHPEAARHVEDAQKAGKPDILTVDRGGSKNRRKEAMGRSKPVKGSDRDEYPPAVTKEGGRGASVRPISPRDNRGAGSSVGRQIRNVPDGSKIKVKVKKQPD